jgi:hypothetical protein
MDVARKHQERIARDTLKLSDAMVPVMGGMTKAEACRILGLDPDETVRSVCENCGAPADYDPELILCPECEREAGE